MNEELLTQLNSDEMKTQKLLGELSYQMENLINNINRCRNKIRKDNRNDIERLFSYEKYISYTGFNGALESTIMLISTANDLFKID